MPHRKALRVLVTLATLAFASPVLAESSVLLIVQSAIDQDPAPCELRLRSEFAAEGLEVVTASARARQSLIDLEGLARRTGAVAGLSVMVDVQSIDGRLWVIDPSSRVDLVRTIHVPRTEADPVSVFALRAVEALRGARLELEQQKRKLAASTSTSTDNGTGTTNVTTGAGAPSTPPPAATPEPVPQKKNPNPPIANNALNAKKQERHPAAATRPPALHARPWLVQATGVFGWELNGLGTVLGPGLELRRAITPRLAAGFGLDGPLFSKLSPRAGTVVRINQEWLSVQLRWAALSTASTSLDIVGVTGLSRFGVRGEAQAPNRGVNSHGFGWLLGAGLGFGIHLSSWLRVEIDAQWLRRLPAPVIIDDQNNRVRRLTGDTDSLLLGKLGFGVMF